MENVLVPETAILLIIADLGINSDEAKEVWAASGRYGRSMYPASDDEIQKWAIQNYKRDNAREEDKVIVIE